MGLFDYIETRGAALKGMAYKWVAFGFLIFLASAFFLDGSRQKTFFYFLVALPALFLLVRSRAIFRADPLPMVAVLLFLSYFSISALWSKGDGEFSDAAKLSLYIYCLMLAIEATARRFSPDFLAGFIVVVGGAASFSYILAILLGNIGFLSLVEGRRALHSLGGWGSDNPITSAVILGVPVISAWWMFSGKRWYIQLALAVLIAANILLIFFTKSRGPLLALGITLLLIVVLRRSKSDFYLVVAGGMLMAGFALFSNVDAVVAERAAAPNYRLDIWLQALERFQENWLLGQGFDHDARIAIASGQVVTHSHSSIFEVFRVGGILGGGLFIAMLFLLVRQSLMKPVGLFFLLWLIYGLICLSTNGRLPLHRPSVEWFAFWTPLFLLYFSRRAAVSHQEPAGELLAGKPA